MNNTVAYDIRTFDPGFNKCTCGRQARVLTLPHLRERQRDGIQSSIGAQGGQQDKIVLASLQNQSHRATNAARVRDIPIANKDALLSSLACCAVASTKTRVLVGRLEEVGFGPVFRRSCMALCSTSYDDIDRFPLPTIVLAFRAENAGWRWPEKATGGRAMSASDPCIAREVRRICCCCFGIHSDPRTVRQSKRVKRAADDRTRLRGPSCA